MRRTDFLFCPKESSCESASRNGGQSSALPSPSGPRYGTLAASSSFISARPIFRAPIPQALRGERQYLRKEKPRTRRRGFFFAKQARANRRRRSPWCKFQTMTASSEIQVEVQGPLILTAAGFCAVYYKPKTNRNNPETSGPDLTTMNSWRELGWRPTTRPASSAGLREGDYPDAPPSSPQNPVHFE